MRVTLNGEACELADGATVADLVQGSAIPGERGRGIAVAIDAEVVPRSAWEATELTEGQAVELLTAIQGG